MAADPLEKFRTVKRTAAAPATSETAAPVAGREAYVAFETKDKVERLRIIRAWAATRSPSYHYLMDVVYDGPYGTNFVLVFSFLIVVVRGRNLQGIVRAIELGTCGFIREFDKNEWDLPAENEALVESIEIVVKSTPDGIADAEKIKLPEKSH